ncbi:MAG: DMT family transporter [Hyphomicrobiales bacterium]|nr:DMT family transporter [Hyphomicrobiales bacterium]
MTGLSPPAWLWVVFTVAAAAAQTARNAMQRDLIQSVGTSGATYVRFLFGLPFAALFLSIACVFLGPPPSPGSGVLVWAFAGGVTQILATGLLLAAMAERSFVVAIAYTKTEPVQVALFGLAFLNEHVTPQLALAISVATCGVMVMSWPRNGEASGWRAPLLGLGSAALWAFSAVAYRAAILALGAPSFLLGAATVLTITLALQSALIVAGLLMFDRAQLMAIIAQWRASLRAGFVGALGSQLWFFAFAIESAARVRTMGLIEMVFAQIVSRRVFRQTASPREYAGMALTLTGVLLLLLA